MQYEISFFFIKIQVEVFCSKFDLNVKHRSHFSNKNHGLYKKALYRKNNFFSVDYVKIIKLHVVHT